MAHFIFSAASVGNTRVLLVFTEAALRPPPTHAHTVHRLFTIHVLNKNEVRKWFQGYRSCRTSNSVKEQVTKNKCVHVKKEGFTQLLHLWLQSGLNQFHSLVSLIDFHQGF